MALAYFALVCESVFVTSILRMEKVRSNEPGLGTALVRPAKKRFQCSECEKGFQKKYNLKIHMRSHTGETPYVCKSPGCGLRFTWRSSLLNHQRYHNMPSVPPSIIRSHGEVELPNNMDPTAWNMRLEDSPPSTDFEMSSLFANNVRTRALNLILQPQTSDVSLDLLVSEAKVENKHMKHEPQFIPTISNYTDVTDELRELEGLVQMDSHPQHDLTRPI